MNQRDRHGLTRRQAVSALAGAAAALSQAGQAPAEPRPPVTLPPLPGQLKQSVCQWCYDGMPLDDLCRNARDMGLKSVELLGEKQWDTVKRYGLTCAMANGPTTIAIGLNRPSEHDRFVTGSDQTSHRPTRPRRRGR